MMNLRDEINDAVRQAQQYNTPEARKQRRQEARRTHGKDRATDRI